MLMLAYSGADAVALVREHMISGCINERIYQGLHAKHLANRRSRTADERGGWKVKAASRKAQRRAARKESESEAESTDAESTDAESVEVSRSKKGKRAARPARARPLNRPDTESRASDLLKGVLDRGGGGLLNFIETVSWSLSIWSPQS